jgi:hypothetical protein
MADWFIARNGQQEGPLSEQAVRMFISAGQLRREDSVWQQGMPEWLPAGRVPQWAELFQNKVSPTTAEPAVASVTQTSAVSYALQGGAGRTTVLTDRGLDMLRKTKPWARLLGVLILVGAGFMVVGGVLMIAMGIFGAAARYGSSASDVLGITFMGVLYLLFAVMYLMPGVYLNRYASRIGDLVQGGREDQLEQALEAQKSFWKFVGIAALLTIVLWIGTIFVIAVAAIIGAGASHTTSTPFPNAPHIPAVPQVPSR